LQAAPGVKALVTSREKLNLRGETVYSLSGMRFPTHDTADVQRYDAAELLARTAQRVRPDFTLSDDDLPAVTRICQLVEGMPLGIELAAGWIDVLPLAAIADQLQRGMDILETEFRDVPERQRSIRATFRATWERLTADEQAAFRRLSVFRGGFTVEAAQAVAVRMCDYYAGWRTSR
jgi:predicted ATPase